MNNLLEVKNDILKPLAENELKEKLTKKVVLKYVSQMRIDQNVSISELDFKVKLQLIFDECCDLTNNQFIENCKTLAKKDLYNKIPPAFKFKDPHAEGNKPSFLSQYKHLLSK